MPAIDRDAIRRLAHLARIRLSPGEEVAFARDLDAIVRHIADLETVGTEGVVPMIGAGETKNEMRSDEPFATERGIAAEAFPEKKGAFLAVPKVL